MKLTIWEFIGVALAAIIVCGVVYIVATRRQYMDGVSWVLAFCSGIAAFFFAGYTLFLKP